MFTHGNDEVYIENKGQWHSNILYNKILPYGNFYLEKDGFTYYLWDKSYIHELHQDKTTEQPEFVQTHTIKTKFLNHNAASLVSAQDKSSFYYNYLIGNDQSKWTSYVYSFGEVNYTNLYNGINLKVYEQEDYTKYDFIVSPQGNPQDIKIEYQGQDEIFIQNGNLYISNTVNDMIEQRPYAYQVINGVKHKVTCDYVLNGDVLSYNFPNGYDKTLDLIIDPIVVFASYSGSTADNFGFTATYDDAENAYAGGIVFSSGQYPVTPGAFQGTFNGVVGVDMGISKFSADGSSLIYSTYIGGGTSSDAPHSLVTNAANELFIMGTTGCNDFPTLANAYDASFNGGIGTSPLYSGVNYQNGSDIVVVRLNATGTGLIGSTYVGGTGNDGLNLSGFLAYSYADGFRGEIILDQAGNCIVATTTNSTDFPIDTLASQPIFGGGLSDGVAFKLDAALSTMIWGTYIGGSSDDAAYGAQFDSGGDVYIAGGTVSSDFYTTSTALDTLPQGQEDGFVVRYNVVSNTIVASTYLGTPGYDQCYFVQLDINDFVYVTGQSNGNYPIVGSVYSNPNSGQFIHKMSNTFDTTYWSTQVGSGRGVVDLCPSAFLVNNCGYIYLSGWGGPLAGIGYYRADYSNTIGLPITPDAHQSTTDGRDFYLMVLNDDAANLLYGTYFGGGVSSEHVDGGTSRFDKKGNVYQAVCAGCGSHDDFPTTPGAWSNTNNSYNCNLGIFKINLEYIFPIASAPVPFICLPDSVSFQNNSSGGNTYYWDFGDGDTSSLFNPTHVYADTGDYLVTLIVSDSTGCMPPDTAELIIDVYRPKLITIQPVDTICVGDTVQIDAEGGQHFYWTPTSTLVNDTVEDPLAFPTVTTTYQLISTHYCNTDTGYVTVPVQTSSISIDNDTIICEGTSIQLSASGGISYNWYPAVGLVNGNTASPTFTPPAPMYYYVDVVSDLGCEFTDSVYIDFYTDSTTIINDTAICINDNITLFATGGGTYSWTPAANLDNASIANPTASPLVDTRYYVDVVSPNGCLLRDSMFLTVHNDPHTIIPDTSICFEDSIQLFATGGGTYAWSPATGLSNPNIANPMASPSVTTTYYLAIISGPNSCPIYDSVTIVVYNDPISVSNDTTICEGLSVMLNATGGGSYNWMPTSTLDNANLSNPTATPVAPTNYIVDITTVNGCFKTDSVYVDFFTDTMSIINDTSICITDSIQLVATGGGSYNWLPSTGLNNPNISNPIASPNVTTRYTVEVTTPNGCLLRDSMLLTVFDDPHTIINDTSICFGDSVQLYSTGGGFYVWNPSAGLSNSNVANPMASPSVTTTYTLDIESPNGCPLFDSVTVVVHNEPISINNDTTICIGNSASLSVTGGTVYSWGPAGSLNNPNIANPTATPASTTRYYADITTPSGCVKQDSVVVFVDANIPTPTISNDTSMCFGDTITLMAGGASKVEWIPATGLSNPLGSPTLAYPPASTTYVVEYTNTCGVLYDSVTVIVNTISASVSPDVNICRGETVNLSAFGGDTYLWDNETSILSRLDSSSIIVRPTEPTTYYVLVSNVYGCSEYLAINVGFYPDPVIDAGKDVVINYGGSTVLTPTGTQGSYVWTPSDSLSCANCQNPTASPNENIQYTVTLTDENGCVTSDSVMVYIDGILFVPNTFSPDGDGINDMFITKGENIDKFTLWVFNRWGQLLFQTNDINKGWDGKYNGELSKTDTYVWRVKYTHVLTGEKIEKIGHVNLLR